MVHVKYTKYATVSIGTTLPKGAAFLSAMWMNIVTGSATPSNGIA